MVTVLSCTVIAIYVFMIVFYYVIDDIEDSVIAVEQSAVGFASLVSNSSDG